MKATEVTLNGGIIDLKDNEALAFLRKNEPAMKALFDTHNATGFSFLFENNLEDTIHVLKRAREHSAKVVSLEFREFVWKPHLFQRFFRPLIETFTALQYVSLSHSFPPSALMVFLAENLKDLKILDVSDTKLKSDDCPNIVKCIKAAGKLEWLSLESNSFGFHNIKSIAFIERDEKLPKLKVFIKGNRGIVNYSALDELAFKRRANKRILFHTSNFELAKASTTVSFQPDAPAEVTNIKDVRVEAPKHQEQFSLFHHSPEDFVYRKICL